MAPVSRRPHNSIVTKFYDVDSNDRTKKFCKLCKKKVACGKIVGKLSSDNLKNHLKKHHSSEFDAAHQIILFIYFIYAMCLNVIIVIRNRMD